MHSVSVPRARLVLWALLLPVTYAPLYLIGARPGPSAWLTLTASIALAALAIVLLFWTQVLDRLATVLEARAGRVLALAIVAYVALATYGARARLLGFGAFDQVGRYEIGRASCRERV